MGITYSDVRLALLIETHFEQHYAPKPTPYRRPIRLPTSWSNFPGHRVIINKFASQNHFPPPDVPPIPPLPSAHAGYIDDDIIVNVMRPLYKRYWAVSHRYRVHLIPETAYEFKYRVTRFQKQFRFRSREALYSFTKAIIDLSMKKTVCNLCLLPHL